MRVVFTCCKLLGMEDNLPAKAGQKLTRGVLRLLRAMDHAPLAEFMPVRGLRVDAISIAPKGEIWIIECKSSRADFLTDHKWQDYLPWCDRYFWAVDQDFALDLLPEGQGLIRADAWGAELIRMAPETKLAGARRSRIQREIARVAAQRLMAVTDPMGISGAAY